MNHAIRRAEKSLVACYGWCNADDRAAGGERRRYAKRAHRRAVRRYSRAVARGEE